MTTTTQIPAESAACAIIGMAIQHHGKVPAYWLFEQMCRSIPMAVFAASVETLQAAGFVTRDTENNLIWTKAA